MRKQNRYEQLRKAVAHPVRDACGGKIGCDVMFASHVCNSIVCVCVCGACVCVCKIYGMLTSFRIANAAPDNMGVAFKALR